VRLHCTVIVVESKSFAIRVFSDRSAQNSSFLKAYLSKNMHPKYSEALIRIKKDEDMRIAKAIKLNKKAISIKKHLDQHREPPSIPPPNHSASPHSFH
jgi:hypothetical protein